MLEVGLASQELNTKQLRDIEAAVSDLSGPIKVTHDQTLFTVPFSRNTPFYGRKEYLNEIHNALNLS